LRVNNGGDEALLELLLVLGRDSDGGHKAAIRDDGLLHTIAVHCNTEIDEEKWEKIWSTCNNKIQSMNSAQL
jgi:hypothetical protein